MVFKNFVLSCFFLSLVTGYYFCRWSLVGMFPLILPIRESHDVFTHPQVCMNIGVGIQKLPMLRIDVSLGALDLWRLVQVFSLYSISS